jgi:hypothetical protein
MPNPPKTIRCYDTITINGQRLGEIEDSDATSKTVFMETPGDPNHRTESGPWCFEYIRCFTYDDPNINVLTPYNSWRTREQQVLGEVIDSANVGGKWQYKIKGKENDGFLDLLQWQEVLKTSTRLTIASMHRVLIHVRCV